jgi:hypothetical protein
LGDCYRLWKPVKKKCRKKKFFSDLRNFDEHKEAERKSESEQLSDEPVNDLVKLPLVTNVTEQSVTPVVTTQPDPGPQYRLP